jgi:nucleoside phosphorylase
VLFTNYQFYIDEFIKLGHALMADPGQRLHAFVEPGNVVTRRIGAARRPGDELGAAPPRLPQMPAYHLVRADRSGITMVNIGVGPANAKTITDHIAVLRPHAWLMLGHCAGLRNSQQLGDYVLAHGYVREDHVLDEELPLWVPIPPLAEVQVALEQAVADVTQLKGYELKRSCAPAPWPAPTTATGSCCPARGARSPERRFSQSRAVALDMESATIAANGFRFRVPYGTLLCVSDKPLHGEIKLPGMANHFYRERVDQHLRIGMRAIELLRQERRDRCTAASCAASPRWRSSLELESATATLEQTRARVPALRQTLMQDEHALAVLLGLPPAALGPRLAAAPLSLPLVPELPAVGVPAQLLQRRPDLRAAEWKATSALATLAQQQAARKPGFTLSGSLALQAATLSGLGGSGALLAGVASAVNWTLLDGGAGEARVAAQQAALDSARITWQAAVLAALQDVEDSLSALATGRERVAALLRASASADEALALARHRWQAGLVDHGTVLDAERTALSAADSLAGARTDVASSHIRLLKALGGGIGITPEQP